MLQKEIEKLFENPPEKYLPEHYQLFQHFKDALNRGQIRAAEPDPASPTGWRVNAWVKKGILLGFRMGELIDMSVHPTRLPFFDKATYPLKRLTVQDRVRLVPGGSSIRDGVYVGPSVTCMPPMYINVGAYVDSGTMVDSHVLIGSCAQIGKNCHISAGAQIGGVLEPVGALPVIIEDQVLVGGNCGVYEGTVVKQGVVLGAGVILTRSTPVYDLVRGEIYCGSAELPLVIPENAVVVPGSRPIQKGKGQQWGLSLYTPVIIKYRDERTEAKIQLEDLLR